MMTTLALSPGVADRPVGTLTARQQEVLALVAEGWSNVAIAGRLGISERAVVAHMTNIYVELGLLDSPHSHRRVLAAVRFLRDLPGWG